MDSNPAPNAEYEDLRSESELIHVISTDDAYGIEAYWHSDSPRNDAGASGSNFPLTT